ncbi:unnamed protein product [Orchesella dallaii]|uniref:Gustatory receptor n=1 Tax=Orchesella dallaii TaxID=48710 RepID=A0ABP1RBK5_9HEXA
METKEDESTFRGTMANGLRPLIRINFLLGVSTYTLSSTGVRQHPCQNFSLARVIFTLILIIISASFTFYKMVDTLIWNQMYLSDAVSRFNKMVDLICQFVANITPCTIMLLGLVRANATNNFFDEMEKYNAGVGGFAEPRKVHSVSRRCLAMLAIIIAILTLLLLLRVDPWEIMVIVGFKDKAIELLAALVFSIIEAFLIICKQTAITFIEVFSVALATCFNVVIENLTKFILKEAESWEEEYVGKQKEFRMKQEANREAQAESVNQQKRTQGMTPGQKICYVISKMQCVSTMQSTVNGVIGPFIALDLVFIVVQVVILTYLLIRNIGVHISGLYPESQNSYIPVQEYNASAIITSNAKFLNNEGTETKTYLFIASPYGWLFFFGCDLCLAIRLILIIKYLAKVYNSSVKFNGALSNALITAQRLTDLLPKVRGELENEKKYVLLEEVRPLVTSTEAHTIVTFVSVNSANPVAATAGGLFTFTGSTILLIASVIISYVVFLLQA